MMVVIAIDKVGDGRLYIRASDGIYMSNLSNALYLGHMTQVARLSLYHNGSPKLATTATGIDVTGTVVADGLTVDSVITLFQEGVSTYVTNLQTLQQGILSLMTLDSDELLLNHWT
jgi:hypothetical protein